MDVKWDNAQRDFQALLHGDKGNLYNLGYFYRKEIPDRQNSYDQVVASFIQPIKTIGVLWAMLNMT
jgi:LPS-assembly protein